jgi:hypothetical protein
MSGFWCYEFGEAPYYGVALYRNGILPVELTREQYEQAKGGPVQAWLAWVWARGEGVAA